MPSRERREQLPIIQLVPTVRHQGSFKCAQAYPDQEDDRLYLQIYCQGMDVTVSATLEQIEHIAKVAQELVDEHKELRK